jgi:hypothetical protein
MNMNIKVKIQIYKIVFKKFSKNVITIPPRLKAKNPVKENKNKVSPIYNLLKSEKFVESKNEKFNIEEKMDYETIISEGSKNLLLNYFKIYEDRTMKLKDLKSLYDFLSDFLSAKELNVFINFLKEAKEMIESEEVEKTEKVFKMFLDKLYHLSSNKSKS